MANINHQWKKFVAVGCNHSVFACRNAQDAVMTFTERWKPTTRIDLGDVHDFTAFRTGAKGTKDEGADVGLDFKAGVDWLKRFRPTHRVNGNHDHRIHKLLDSPNAIVAHCAGKVIEDIREVDEKNGTLVKPYFMRNWWKFGDTKFGHGWMFNVNAVRDHAESYGKCVIAHLHVPSEARGRRDDSPVGWCVGTLAQPDLMTYAHGNRNWLCWAHGFVWGEYNDRECIVRLERKNCEGKREQWRLPL
jgi:hypothetical protein